MVKLLEKFNQLIDKIGKPNFILIVFITFIVVVTGLYSTFSMYTATEEMSIIDGIETFKFIISANNSSNIVTIPSNSEKNVAITVNNPEKIRLKYGIYYATTYDLKDVSIGYLETSDYKATDIIESNTNAVVTIKVYNDSENDIMISFGLSYGLENGGDLKIDNTKKWVEKIDFERFNLNEAPIGSYISYVGTNDCVKDSCLGRNTNYKDEDNLGYCKNASDTFKVNGWRIAYIKELSPYIISASSPECISLINDQNNNKLDTTALKYCNSKYIYGGICSDINTWNMNINDFKNITKNNLYYNTLDDNSCFESKENKECGYEQDLIDTGSWYWINDEAGLSALAYTWNPIDRYMTYGNNEEELGLRPVLRLDTNIEVIGGKGTMKEPYIIENKEAYIEE